MEQRQARKDRIRADELQLLSERAEKQVGSHVRLGGVMCSLLLTLSLLSKTQRHAIELQEERRSKRLATEREREQQALALVEEMQQEERNLTLRLEALKLHKAQLAPFLPMASASQR